MNDCKEEVAYKLLCDIAVAQGKATYITSTCGISYGTTDKEWILDTYTECLETVLRQRNIEDGPEQTYAL